MEYEEPHPTIYPTQPKKDQKALIPGIISVPEMEYFIKPNSFKHCI